MKKILMGVVGLIALGAAPALAADLPARTYSKAPAVVPVAYYNWSGLYWGLNGGGGSAHKCWDINNLIGVVIPTTREGCQNATGGVFGGQIGYRWQQANFVFGLEAQGDWAGLKGSSGSVPTVIFAGVPLVTDQTKVNSFGLFTGQVGYAWNNVLWYVKGGAAVTGDKYNGIVTSNGVVFDRATETRWGGTVGTGIEVGFAPNWSVGFEYDHLFMGSRNVTFNFTNVPVVGLSRIDNIKQDVDIGTIRVNYRWGGPAVARY